MALVVCFCLLAMASLGHASPTVLKSTGKSSRFASGIVRSALYKEHM